MAAMEPSRNIEGFRASLEQVRAGAYPDYAFYLALLYTTEPGLDARLSEWVRDYHWALDRQTGEHTLAFLVSDAVEGTPGGREFRPQDVYDIARSFGVKPRALPCAVVFLDPDRSADTVVVRLERFVPGAQGPEEISRAMRAIASALEECSERPRGGRIECLRAQLEAMYLDVDPARRADPLEDAARTSDAVARTVANGATVAAAVAAALRTLGLG